MKGCSPGDFWEDYFQRKKDGYHRCPEHGGGRSSQLATVRLVGLFITASFPLQDAAEWDYRLGSVNDVMLGPERTRLTTWYPLLGPPQGHRRLELKAPSAQGS